MATNKTVETDEHVDTYINHIADKAKSNDTVELIRLMQKQTGFPPKMWGTSIVGFGTYHYKYDSGREGDAPVAALSARANAITLYLADFEGRDQLLKKLGKHKTGKGCIYVQKLTDINTEVLQNIISQSVAHRKNEHLG